METFKLTLHFINKNDFLEGYNTIVTAHTSTRAIQTLSNYNWWITTWRGKAVCINLRNVAYIECEEVKE